MSIKEKFNKICGTPLEFDFFADYIITLDAADNCALIDVEKYEKNIEWKPFVPLNLPKEGFLRYKQNTFNFHFINRAIEVLNPNEYYFRREHNKADKTYDYILILKNGNYAIMIAPCVDVKDIENIPEKEYDWEDIIKEAPKSVFVI